MPEGARSTPVVITIKYKEYRECHADGYRICTFYVSGSEYLELPLDANVRLPTEASIPYKEMVKTLESNPEKFMLQNNGMSIIATTVTIVQRNNTVKLLFQPGTGIVNGGHTQLALLNVKGERDVSNATVRLEVIEHAFSPEELAMIATSRNTASNVKPYSTAEKRGYFAKIKPLMLPEFEKRILWFENREVPDERGLSAVDFIALLNLFNIELYQSPYNEIADQPNKSATSKTAVFKLWEINRDKFLHVYPLVNDIVNLQEHVSSTFNTGIPRGFTTLSVVEKNEPPKRTLFLGKEKKFELPKQFLLPILASMRAVIKYDSYQRKVGWHEKPEDVFDRCKHKIFEVILRTYKSTYHNEINRASKDQNLWQILYRDVLDQVKKDSEWKMYDIP